MEEAGLETKVQRYKLQKFDGTSPLLEQPQTQPDKTAIDLGSIKLQNTSPLLQKDYEM